jgi:hypothetical protein
LKAQPGRYRQAAGTLALNDDLAVPLAQFDLSNMAAGGVNLLGDQGRAGNATASLAFGDVTASVDAYCSGFGLKIRLEHPKAVLRIV